jgi:hypothetical protein
MFYDWKISEMLDQHWWLVCFPVFCLCFVCLKSIQICFFLGSRMFVIYYKSKYTVTHYKFCTTWKILYLPQVLGTSYHINMIIYKYSIYIFEMNMKSGSHALLHVGKSKKMRFWHLHKYFMWEFEKIWTIKY